MKSFIFLAIVSVAGTVAVFGQEPTNEYERLLNEQRKEKMQQELRARDVPIVFYGVIRDQNGTAVQGATVNLSVKQYDFAVGMGIKKLQVVSTNDGTFRVIGERGWMLYINGIEKCGYEYKYDSSQPNSFNYPATGSYADPGSPAVFKVRKKEPPTLVIPGNFRPQLKYSGDVRAVDLVQGEIWKVGVDATYEYPELMQDVLVTVRQNESQSEFTVTLSTTNAMDGVLMSDDLLYVAPVSGYQPKVEFSLPMGARNEAKRFYVKGRGGNLHARIDVNLIAYPERLLFTMRTWANPRGERNLDYDETLYRQYKEQLR